MISRLFSWIRKHWVLSILIVIAVASLYMTAARYQERTVDSPYPAFEELQ